VAEPASGLSLWCVVLTVDFHCHAFAASLLPSAVHQHRARSVLIQRGADPGALDERVVDRVASRIAANMEDSSADLLVADLDRAGFDRGVVVGIDWGLMGLEVPATRPQAWLEWGSSIVERHPDRLAFVLGIDPRRPEAGILAREALQEPFVAGIKLYPPAGFDADAEVCDPIYEAAIAANVFVMSHTGRQTYPFDLARGRLEQYAKVQRRYPALRLVLAHAGAPLWGYEALHVASGHPSTYLEFSGWGEEITTRPDFVAALLRDCWAELGPRRVLFGSDHLSGPYFSDDVSGLIGWKRFFERSAQTEGIDLAVTDDAAQRLLNL
jgi:predicted TIM-barrel fold metal-dependent hydrolase